MYVDEAQAWLIARNNSSVIERDLKLHAAGRRTQTAWVATDLHIAAWLVLEG
jgi:hypothetical protein